MTADQAELPVVHVCRAAVTGYLAQVRFRWARRWSELVQSPRKDQAIAHAARGLALRDAAETRVLALCDPETDPAGGEPFLVWSARVVKR
ncbi:MAG: hypothetical protein KIS74_02910 [Burkholderiales bacterium]|nr:hypothetical protein [Burkholderiales bacterium]